MDKFFTYLVFQKLAENRSFTKTASSLYMSQPNVTRILSDLETELGCQLINRSTRSVHLTQKGQEFYKHCKSITQHVSQFEESFLADSETLTGTLNMTAPIFLHDVFYGVIGDFLKLHPKLSINLNVTNSYLNLLENNLDMAVQVGREAFPNNEVPDSKKRFFTLVGYRQMVMLATPEYIEKNGPIRHPKDLIRHNCLIFSLENKTSWKYMEKEHKKIVEVSGTLISNSMTPIYDCLFKSIGIAYLPYYYVKKELAKQNIVEILPDFRPEPDPVYVSHMYDKYTPNNVQQFSTFLTESDLFELPVK